jgi:hypothetical protein
LLLIPVSSSFDHIRNRVKRRAKDWRRRKGDVKGVKSDDWRVKSEGRLNRLPHTLAFCKNILLLVLVAVVLKLWLEIDKLSDPSAVSLPSPTIEHNRNRNTHQTVLVDDQVPDPSLVFSILYLSLQLSRGLLLLGSLSFSFLVYLLVGLDLVRPLLPSNLLLALSLFLQASIEATNWSWKSGRLEEGKNGLRLERNLPLLEPLDNLLERGSLLYNLDSLGEYGSDLLSADSGGEHTLYFVFFVLVICW